MLRFPVWEECRRLAYEEDVFAAWSEQNCLCGAMRSSKEEACRLKMPHIRPLAMKARDHAIRMSWDEDWACRWETAVEVRACSRENE